MKYYHVIYNSSQRTQNNGVGLGVRTFTQGTPNEYLDALKTAGLFAYSSGNMPQPNAQMLFKDGKLIEQLPVSYCYSKILVPATDKYIYVISRTISVGFDYPYYLKNAVARLDNFVLDAYIFETYPGEETMEIFYGDPAEGAVRFVPKSAVPSPENEEMKTLSVGHADLLPEEELEFRTKVLKPVNTQSFELLFAYIEANRLQQPLFVKCDPNLAPLLMADLMRLLPNHLEEDATFWSNYQEEGWRDGYHIYFVNDTYRYDYLEQSGVYVLDLAAGETAQSIEAISYKQDVIKLVNDNNLIDLDKLLAWMLNPIYSKIREKSDSIKRILYNYTIEPDKFTLLDLSVDKDELWPVLQNHFSSCDSNQQVLNKNLKAALSIDNSALELFKVIDLCNDLESNGFQLDWVFSSCKTIVSEHLLSSEETFLAALQHFDGINNFSKFIDKKVFESKSYFLDNAIFADVWPSIFDLFCDAEDRKPEVLIKRLFENKLPKNTRDLVLQKINISQSELLNTLINVLSASNAELAWTHIEEILSAQINSQTLSLNSKGAESIQSYIIAPLSMKKDMSKWSSLMDLVQEKVNADNISNICNWADTLKNEKYLNLILMKGLNLLNYQDLRCFIEKVSNSALNVAPASLINRLIDHKHFTQIASDILVIYHVKKKDFLKQFKDGRFDNIDDDQVNDIVVGAYGAEKAGIWRVLRAKISLSIIIIFIMAVLVLLLFIVFPPYPYVKEFIDNFEIVSTTENVSLSSIGADSATMLVADSVKNDSIVIK